MEVKILNEVMPVIEINFEQMKEALIETLKKYDGIVVTEETLSGCKTTQRDLAGARNKIDTYRKNKKKELSKPIADFENQCKELISLIEQAEKPIKDGIKVFDDQKRAEKRLIAENLIKVVIEEVELNEKYGSRLDVLDKYCNLTAKESDVKSDLEARAFVLKVEQDRESELIDIIKDVIDTENQKIKAKMDFADFERLIDRGMATKDVLAEIKSRANGIYKAENPPEPTPEPMPEPTPEPEQKITPQEKEEADDTVYYAVYRITGGVEELRGVSKYLKDNNITYSVTDQGEV